MTSASTAPSVGWRNASGSRPTISNPMLCQSRTARSLLLTTKLNCIARKPRSFARSKECRHMARAMPRPLAHGAVMYPQFATCAPPLLIRPQIVCAQNFSAFFSDEYLVPWRSPVGERVLAILFRGQRVGIPCANHRFEDFPDGLVVACSCCPNHHYAEPVCRVPPPYNSARLILLHRQHHAKLCLAAHHSRKRLIRLFQRILFNHRFHARLRRKAQRILRIHRRSARPSLDVSPSHQERHHRHFHRLKWCAH